MASGDVPAPDVQSLRHFLSNRLVARLGQTFPAIASRALAVLLSVVVARAREAGKLARVLVSNHQSHKGKV